MSTKIRDPLYEEFELPTYLHGLLSCWEIQRLRYVRLINVNSLPLSVLGETSRYSHTLGVLQLGMVCLRENGVPIDDSLSRLFLSALALHDAGTPAFGHSLEYILKRQGAGDHVKAIIAAISGDSPLGKYQWSCVPERAAHSRLRAELKKLLGPHFKDNIIEALNGEGPIGHLVSSKSIDLDNVDNVFRMASALGMRDWAPEDPIAIARSFDVNCKDDFLTCRGSGIESIKRWRSVRRAVYEILNLHPLNLSGLAMLRECFEIDVDAEGDFPSSAWWTVDAEILNNLSRFASHLIDRIKRGDLYKTLLILWIDTSNDDLRPLENLNSCLRLFSYRLAEVIDHRVRVHAVLDRGTFERNIPIFIVDQGLSESVGITSRSIIISVHSQSNSTNYPAKQKIERSLIALLSECFDVGPDLIKGAILGHEKWSPVAFPDEKQISLW